MTLQKRDKTALKALAAAVAVWLVLQFALSRRDQPAAMIATGSIPVAEKRLAKLRQLAASVPGKEQVLKQAAAELAEREKGIIQSETAPQAQAQLLEILRRVGRSQTPPMDVKPGELGRVSELSENYGEVQVSIALDCRIEEFLNFAADLTRQPEALATKELRITSAKDKTIAVRLTVSGVVPRRLVPEKKGVASF
jgi:hypothetical protein